WSRVRSLISAEMAVESCMAHVLVGEPVPTSPEHALDLLSKLAGRCVSRRSPRGLGRRSLKMAGNVFRSGLRSIAAIALAGFLVAGADPAAPQAPQNDEGVHNSAPV